jgi:hypothetical protein
VGATLNSYRSKWTSPNNIYLRSSVHNSIEIRYLVQEKKHGGRSTSPPHCALTLCKSFNCRRFTELSWACPYASLSVIQTMLRERGYKLMGFVPLTANLRTGIECLYAHKRQWSQFSYHKVYRVCSLQYLAAMFHSTLTTHMRTCIEGSLRTNYGGGYLCLGLGRSNWERKWEAHYAV